MKVLALGGCGDMGRMAVTALLTSDKVSSITVADKNVELAKKFVDLLGSEKVSATEIDVYNKDKLHELISNHDVVMNTIGPYFKFGKLILEAVIKAKRNYVDIADDWKPMLELLELHEEAKKAGITAIVGLGASPGLSNLMAVIAASELDEVDELITAWGLSTTKGGKKLPNFVNKKILMKNMPKGPEKASAALIHLLHECIGPVPTWRNGKQVEIEPLDEEHPVEFPGMKPYYGVHVGHPEPVTLPRTINANTISCIMFFGERITSMLRDLVNEIKNEQRTIDEGAIYIDHILNRFSTIFIVLWEYLKRLFKLPPEVCVTATGMKNGKKKKIGIGIKYRPYGEIDYGMDGLTSIPLAIGALMIIEGQITKTGVLTPEESIDPKEFFNRYAKFCKKNLKGEDVLIKRELELES